VRKFLVIRNTEEGGVYVEVRYEQQLLCDLAAGLNILHVPDVTMGRAVDFANEGPRGALIFPLGALVTPRPIKVETRWEIP